MTTMNRIAESESNSKHIFMSLAHYLPYLLPLLLLFSRAIADVTVLLIGLYYLLRSYYLNDWQWAKHTWFKLSIGFWLYLLLVNTPLSIDQLDSLTHSAAYIRWPLFAAAIAYWVLDNEKSKRNFLISLLLISFLIMADTSLQYVTGQDLFGHLKPSPTRLTGPYSRPIPGIMLLRVIFIGMFAAILLPSLSDAKRQVKFILLTLCIGLVFMFITGERMALILFITGSAVITCGLLLNQTINTKKLIFSMLTIAGLFWGLFMIAPETAERSVFSIANKLNSFTASDYGVVFRAAFIAWQDNFIFGSGFHTYQTFCEQLGVLTVLGKSWGLQCSHPHNLYLQIAAETGLVGLILFSISIVSIYYHAIANLIKAHCWLVASLSFTVLSVCFWPLIGGISILNNGVAALVWLGVGWVLSIAKEPT